MYEERDEIVLTKLKRSIYLLFLMMLMMMFVASFTAGETYQVVLPLWSNPSRHYTKKCMNIQGICTLVRHHVVPPPACKTRSPLLLRCSRPARHCPSLLPSPARNRGYACGDFLHREHQAIPRFRTPSVSPTSGCGFLARWRCPR